jgi:hypothetical protein
MNIFGPFVGATFANPLGLLAELRRRTSLLLKFAYCVRWCIFKCCTSSSGLSSDSITRIRECRTCHRKVMPALWRPLLLVQPLGGSSDCKNRSGALLFLAQFPANSTNLISTTNNFPNFQGASSSLSAELGHQL